MTDKYCIIHTGTRKVLLVQYCNSFAVTDDFRKASVFTKEEAFQYITDLNSAIELFIVPIDEAIVLWTMTS